MSTGALVAICTVAGLLLYWIASSMNRLADAIDNLAWHKRAEDNRRERREESERVLRQMDIDRYGAA